MPLFPAVKSKSNVEEVILASQCAPQSSTWAERILGLGVGIQGGQATLYSAQAQSDVSPSAPVYSSILAKAHISLRHLYLEMGVMAAPHMSIMKAMLCRKIE